MVQTLLVHHRVLGIHRMYKASCTVQVSTSKLHWVRSSLPYTVQSGIIVTLLWCRLRTTRVPGPRSGDTKMNSV